MKSILAAVAMALVVTFIAMQATPVVAQKVSSGTKDTKVLADEAEAANRDRLRKDDDARHKATMGRMPESKLDPWRNMR